VGGEVTERECLQVQCLCRCTFAPGSYAKRFVHDLATKSADYELSDKQERYLDKLYYMYRNQITVKCKGVEDLPLFIKPEWYEGETTK
jgi:hypothetical protein